MADTLCSLGQHVASAPMSQANLFAFLIPPPLCQNLPRLISSSSVYRSCSYRRICSGSRFFQFLTVRESGVVLSGAVQSISLVCSNESVQFGDSPGSRLKRSLLRKLGQASPIRKQMIVTQTPRSVRIASLDQESK
jgi:hypothetical protein